MKNKKKQDKNKKNNQSKAELPEVGQPWLSKNSGLLIIAVTSISLGGWVAYQMIREGNTLEGILWGIAFAVTIWLVFFGMNWFHGLFRK